MLSSPLIVLKTNHFSICRRALIFTFPYNVIRLFRNIFIALCLSIITGAVYWHVRGGREQENLWDRIGLFHVLLTVLPIPLFLIDINDRKPVNSSQKVLN